jgi:long-chain acyl-CoA synthetase
MTAVATSTRPRPRWLLHDSLLASAEAMPAKAAVVADGEPHSYEELLSDSLRLARALQELGVERGDRVAIQMDNSWACTVSIFGTLLAGGVFLVVNPQTKADKLRYILADSEARVLVADGYLAREYTRATTGLDALRAIVRTGEDERTGGGSLAFDELVAGSEPSPADPGTIPVDLAALIYTSGSTGNPKGVMMTHASMVFAAESISRYLRLSCDDRILDVLPLAFDYGLYQLLMTVGLGATLVLEKSFAFPAHVFRRMEEFDVTVFPGVPTVFATLLSLRAKGDLSFPSVTRVTNTAAALPPDFHERMRQIFPNALLFAMYGLTECKRVSYLEPELLAEKPSSVGKAIPGTEAFVLLPDGRQAPPGETGVLHVRGPHVMLGYWRQPEQSAHMLREGRYPGERMLCTQDYFRTDEDGFLYFVGRSDDIIKTRGEKVSPVEVENVLYGIPGVRQAAVLGVPDELLGQAIRAFVVLDDGADLGEADIIRACRAELENFMVPQHVVILDELPQTTTGKIRKRELQSSE